MPYSNLKCLGQDSKIRKQIESYTRVEQDQREPFSDFLQRLTKAVQIGGTAPDARRVLIESLAFENANSECKKIHGPLKVISPPMDKWIPYTMNIETFDYTTESCLEKAISKNEETLKCLMF